MIRYLSRIGILAIALAVVCVHSGQATPVTLSIDGMAQFDPTPPHGLGALGIVSGQAMSLSVSYDDALIGDGVHEISSATGISLTITLGPALSPIVFTEADDFCYDNVSCNAFFFVDIRNSQIFNVSYVGERTIDNRDYALVVYRDYAESTTIPGFFFDWILADCTGTTNCSSAGISAAGGTLQFVSVPEPAALGLIVLAGLVVAHSRRRRWVQA